MTEHPTPEGMAGVGFRGAGDFYYAGRELAAELAGGADLQEARATVAERCKVTDAQLDYILEHSR